MDAPRKHPTDRTVSKTAAGQFTAYVVRSDHWDLHRAEVWCSREGLVYCRHIKSRSAAQRDADRALDTFTSP